MRNSKAKRRLPSRGSHWDSLSDDELLSVELTTDDPERLENVVLTLPDGDEEPHVEFSYDFRGSERSRLHCVHGNHAHLAGFVMNKGGKRFLVGHMCGKKIYGENFCRYTNDFDAARDRQDLLRRIRAVKDASAAFFPWLEKQVDTDVFSLYLNVRLQIVGWMPWLHEQLGAISARGGQIFLNKPTRDIEAERREEDRYEREHQLYRKGGPKPVPSRKPIYKMEKTLVCTLPTPTFFDVKTRPADEIQKLILEMRDLVSRLHGATPDKTLSAILSKLGGALNRVETIFGQLAEVERFFQPSVLGPVAEWATANDNPKRRYESGLNSITRISDKGTQTVRIPKNYRVPDRTALRAFRAALTGLPISNSVELGNQENVA